MVDRANTEIRFDDGSLGAARLVEAGAVVGAGARAWLADDVSVGNGVVIGAGTSLVADRLVLGDGVQIGANVDLRSSVVELGARCEILSNVKVLVADRFALGAAGRIESAVSITCRTFCAGKLFYLGHHSSVGYGGTTASTAHLRIGDRVALGPNNILNANFPIDLADQVGSGSYLSIWTHGFHFGHRLTDGFEATFQGVRIEPNVWLGFHVSVLPGVTIGTDTIVAGGAVVARDLPSGVLAGGVPAKPIKLLRPREVPDAEMWTKIEALIDSWCEELTWKRIAHKRVGRREVIVGNTQVIGLDVDELPPTHNGTELILLVLQHRPELLVPGGVIFELRSGVLVGAPSPTGQDLRDHLRRHALPCGDDDTFRSLPGAPFSRLTSAVPLTRDTQTSEHL